MREFATNGGDIQGGDTLFPRGSGSAANTPFTVDRGVTEALEIPAGLSSRRVACRSGTTPAVGPTFARVLYQKWSISNPYTTSLCILSVHYVGCRELATIEAHTVANHPQPAIQHMRLVGPTTGQHQPGREIDCGGPYLKHGGGVGPKKERICRFRSHLRAKYKRQCEILAVRFLRVPPVRRSMCAGVIVELGSTPGSTGVLGGWARTECSVNLISLIDVGTPPAR